MPAKRCLLIAVALLAVVLSAQQVSAWSYSSVYHYKSLYGKHLTGYNSNVIVDARFGRTSVELENRFDYTDRFKDDVQERLNERLQLAVSHNWDNGFVKGFYRSDWFDKETGYILPMGSFMPYYEHNFKQAGVSANGNYANLKASFNGRYRSYNFQPVFPMFTKEVKGDNLKSEAEIDFRFYKPLAIYISASDKSALDSDYDNYDISSVGTGLKLDHTFTPIQHIEAQTGIDWRESDAIAQDRLIPVTSKIRYTYMLDTQITGFVSYEARNFYDREGQALLFNSHYLRASGKYTFLYDLSHGSYMEIGGKAAPSEQVKYTSSAIFAQTDIKLTGRFYLGGGINHMIERYTNYEAKAHYFFTPVSEIFVDYIYTDDIEFNEFATYTSAGLRLLF